MKNKKLFLPIIILVAAVLAMAAYAVVSSMAFKPSVTEADFPFSITYELDGKQVTIEDVYRVNYVENDKGNNHKGRIYAGKRLSSGENDTALILKQDEEKNTRVELYMNFHPDYLIGDSYGDYFEEEAFEPKIYYYDANEQEYDDEETLSKQGVKLISFEYPEPIKNGFVFSHFSYLTAEIVLPLLLIALLALLAIIIFVRKEKELTYKVFDFLSIALNIVVGVTLVPFTAIVGVFTDMNGGGPELYRPMLYLTSSFSVLCIAASVALRRKGYRITSFIVTLIGPVAFVASLIVCAVYRWI